jgi:hypothetical protein
VLQRLQELRGVGYFMEKGGLEAVYRGKRILPFYNGRAIAFSALAG